jgi:DNA-binding Lrp family transcriptional regulator
MSPDETDLQILKLLQKDAKMTVKQLSEKLHLTPTPIFERIKKLEKHGFISSYQAILDRQLLGLTMLVFCNVTLQEHQAERLTQFESDVQKLPEVLACYHIGGQDDYLLKVCVKNMGAYHLFVSKTLASLKNIGKVHSSFVMSEVKAHGGLPI